MQAVLPLLANHFDRSFWSIDQTNAGPSGPAFLCRVNGEAERFEGVGVLQLHHLFPTVVATTQLPLDPLQQASCLQALLRLRGEAESNPSEGCAWTGDLHGVWQLHQEEPFQAQA